MNRKDTEKYISDTYCLKPDCPFSNDFDTMVFRHSESKKWFALIMKIDKSKLGIYSNEKVHVMNLKCDPILIGSLIKESYIYPAYHMNKNHWISVILDDKNDEADIKWLIDLSFSLTKK